MLPAYKPGDHVLTFNWSRIKVRDVIVFRKGVRNYLKRVRRIQGDRLYVIGDNTKESTAMGSVNRLGIIGKVIGKY